MTRDSGRDRRHAGPTGLALSSLWLIFLGGTVGLAGTDDGSTAYAGYGAIVVLIVAFVGALALLGQARAEGRIEIAPRTGAALLGVIVAAAAVAVGTLGAPGLTTVVYAAAAAALLLDSRISLLAIGALAAGALVVVLTVHDLADAWVFPALTLLVGILMRAVKDVTTRNVQLEHMRTQNETLLLQQERNRFAQELHDILGHSLTVVAVKAELANRMLDLDVERARTELEDLERLARESLADVRRAVHGYKDVSLATELARAGRALEAAGITAELPSSTDQVIAEFHELFAWAIREGVTNVIRHSRAQTCTVHLEPDRLVIADDGTGAQGPPMGEGLGISGLEERAALVGAQLHTRRVEPRGFVLEVSGQPS